MINPITDLSDVKLPLVYPSRLPIPWPAYKNFTSDKIEKKTLDYLKTYGLSGGKLEEFTISKNSDFICMVFPDGTEEQLQLLSTHVFCFGLLDDIVDQPAQLGTQYEKVVAIFADIELAIDESLNNDLSNFSTIWGKEHAKIYRQFLDFGFTCEDKRLYKKGFLKYKNGSLQQIKYRNSHWKNIPVWKYTCIRREESGIPWYFQFIQWTNGVRLPKYIWNSDVFEKVINLTSDFISHANDTASYPKEYCCGDYSNIVTVILHNYQHLSTQQALFVVAHLAKLVIEEFDNTVEELYKSVTSKKLKNDLDRLILGIRKHISGYALWNSETQRYKVFGDKDLLYDVNLVRIDVTKISIDDKLCRIAKEIFNITYRKNN